MKKYIIAGALLGSLTMNLLFGFIIQDMGKMDVALSDRHIELKKQYNELKKENEHLKKEINYAFEKGEESVILNQRLYMTETKFVSEYKGEENAYFRK